MSKIKGSKESSFGSGPRISGTLHRQFESNAVSQYLRTITATPYAPFQPLPDRHTILRDVVYNMKTFPDTGFYALQLKRNPDKWPRFEAIYKDSKSDWKTPPLNSVGELVWECTVPRRFPPRNHRLNIAHIFHEKIVGFALVQSICLAQSYSPQIPPIPAVFSAFLESPRVKARNATQKHLGDLWLKLVELEAPGLQLCSIFRSLRSSLAHGDANMRPGRMWENFMGGQLLDLPHIPPYPMPSNPYNQIIFMTMVLTKQASYYVKTLPKYKRLVDSYTNLANDGLLIKKTLSDYYMLGIIDSSYDLFWSGINPAEMTADLWFKVDSYEQ